MQKKATIQENFWILIYVFSFYVIFQVNNELVYQIMAFLLFPVGFNLYKLYRLCRAKYCDKVCVLAINNVGC